MITLAEKPEEAAQTLGPMDSKTQISINVARCTEKSVLIRIFEMIRIFIRKSANDTEIQR